MFAAHIGATTDLFLRATWYPTYPCGTPSLVSSLLWLSSPGGNYAGRVDLRHRCSCDQLCRVRGRGSGKLAGIPVGIAARRLGAVAGFRAYHPRTVETR